VRECRAIRTKEKKITWEGRNNNIPRIEGRPRPPPRAHRDSPRFHAQGRVFFFVNRGRVVFNPFGVTVAVNARRGGSAFPDQGASALESGPSAPRYPALSPDQDEGWGFVPSEEPENGTKKRPPEHRVGQWSRCGEERWTSRRAGHHRADARQQGVGGAPLPHRQLVGPRRPRCPALVHRSAPPPSPRW